MMPLQTGRKARKLEKVEKLCRSATAQSILPTCRDLADHACAMVPRSGGRFCAAGKRPAVLAGNKRFRRGIL
jgi:hypothetical protein